jgi:hypothetical protein
MLFTGAIRVDFLHGGAQSAGQAVLFYCESRFQYSVNHRKREKGMRVNTRWYLSSAAALLGLWGGALLLAGAPPDETSGQSRPAQASSAEKIKPRYKPGQKWEVETLSVPLENGNPLGEQTKRKKVLWQLSVLEPQKIAGKSCVRIQVQVKSGNRLQPVATLWLDEKSLALRQVQTQLRVQGSVRTVTESYQSGDQPSPVIAPLTAIPLAMPVFLEGTKAVGAQKFSYETISGPEGKKDPGDVGFAYEIEQEVDLAKDDAVKGLQEKGMLTESFTKDLEAKPLVEVKLKASGRRVQQMWQPGLPWPVYSSNGVTQARLVRVVSK